MRRVLREKDLNAVDGLRKTQRGEMIGNGQYPPPARANDTGRAKIWFSDEIAAWQEWRRR